jgi:hypothetical protein
LGTPAGGRMWASQIFIQYFPSEEIESFLVFNEREAWEFEFACQITAGI